MSDTRVEIINFKSFGMQSIILIAILIVIAVVMNASHNSCYERFERMRKSEIKSRSRTYQEQKKTIEEQKEALKAKREKEIKNLRLVHVMMKDLTDDEVIVFEYDTSDLDQTKSVNSFISDYESGKGLIKIDIEGYEIYIQSKDIMCIYKRKYSLSDDRAYRK